MRSAMTTSSTLLTALIAAATALAVGLLTQLFTWRRERSDRAYERRRAALIDVQEAALVLRARFGESGDLARRVRAERRDGALAAAQRGVDDALAAFVVRLTRVDDQEVLAAAREWRARATYHSISAEEVSVEEEAQAWERLNDRCGAALTSATGRGRGISGAPSPGTAGWS